MLYIAVRNADGEYYLNGHWSLVGSWTGTNDSISYTSKSLYGHSLEKFTANGPTSEVLFVSVRICLERFVTQMLSVGVTMKFIT